MRVSVDPSEVEELAWLVKDNLYTKHLVLSAEELFVEFLQPDYVGGAILELEPMLSYHRMLLHRLADCFGLVHESVGEGDNRHIIIERCEESKTPLMLVSDVLESCYGEVHHAPANRQLLLRVPSETGDQTNPPSVQSPGLSLEEREAAYQAARERIFSDRVSVSPESSSEQRETQRARPVPVVARRMIAHALGKPQVLTADFPPNEVSTTLEDIPSEVPKEAPRHSPAKAARRMLTQALGFPVSSPSSRGPERKITISQSHIVSIEAGLRHSNAEADVASLATETSSGGLKSLEIDEGLRSRDAAVKDVHSLNHSGTSHLSSGATSTRPLRKDRPGAGAGRMFAQALGLPITSQSVVADSATDSMKPMPNESKGGKESLINSNNVLCIAEDSISFVDPSVHLVGSVSKSSEERGCREKSKCLDRSKLEVVLQEVLRKGGGRGNKLENHLRSKNHVFQEDQETGELFLTSKRIIRNGSQKNSLRDS
ncbi:hypothetical protein KC19_4G252200 [Ceratodon purpureus]|uniref:R3H domain-containing protein n=1 Tax=Ceratodon purpureus TaxID=3225 RepID=A0A8T0IG27_CERPU|nr:hypothetical protein KC19_4G252200 [Ceratodon purpureus]